VLSEKELQCRKTLQYSFFGKKELGGRKAEKKPKKGDFGMNQVEQSATKRGDSFPWDGKMRRGGRTIKG